jgi:hypothetical protein
MALNSSGPISLGGATAGQSTNLELGKSATALVSMNDTDLRTLVNVASGVITMPTDFYGKSSVPPYTYRRWYVSMSSPASTCRNLSPFSTQSYPVYNSSDSGVYFGGTFTLPVPAVTPYRGRSFFWKFDTATSTVSWIQRAVNFDTTAPGTASTSSVPIVIPRKSQSVMHCFNNGLQGSTFENHRTNINTSTGDFTAINLMPNGIQVGQLTHNSQDYYIPHNTATTGQAMGKVNPGTDTDSGVYIQTSSPNCRAMRLFSIDSTNDITMMSAHAASTSSGAVGRTYLHKLDSNFNILQSGILNGDGYNTSLQTRNGSDGIIPPVANYNKNIPGNTKIWFQWQILGQNNLTWHIARFDTTTFTFDLQRGVTMAGPWGGGYLTVQYPMVQTEDGGFMARLTSNNDGNTTSWLAKFSASGNLQFTNRFVLTGAYEPTFYQMILGATYKDGIIVTHSSSPGANITSGTNTSFAMNLCVNPAISNNAMGPTSIGNGMTLQIIVDPTVVTVSSMSPTLNLVTASPDYIFRTTTTPTLLTTIGATDTVTQPTAMPSLSTATGTL